MTFGDETSHYFPLVLFISVSHLALVDILSILENDSVQG